MLQRLFRCGPLRWSMVMLAMALVSRSADARFRRPDLVQIPVDRLVTNLEQMAANKPKDVNLRFNLARVLAMAYAQKIDVVQVQRDKPQFGAWHGYTPKSVPFDVKKAKTPAEEKAAMVYLDKALSAYEEVLKRQKDHLPALLGHAWLTEQSGKTKKAIEEYRNVIKMAWAKEGKLKAGRLGGRYVTAEAAEYLIPLLDKKKDSEEVQELQGRIAHLKKLRRPITPIAIPLRDGLTAADVTDRTARVKFDADGSGLMQSRTWIRPNAGWLVYDQRGDGRITSGLQMFGNVTFWTFWDNGYEAMATLDDNGDGFLAGAELIHLAIWHDVNGNGVSERDEVKPLEKWGVVKLACRHRKDASVDCAAWSPGGVHFRDGTVRPTYDVILRRR